MPIVYAVWSHLVLVAASCYTVFVFIALPTKPRLPSVNGEVFAVAVNNKPLALILAVDVICLERYLALDIRCRLFVIYSFHCLTVYGFFTWPLASPGFNPGWVGLVSHCPTRPAATPYALKAKAHAVAAALLPLENIQLAVVARV